MGFWTSSEIQRLIDRLSDQWTGLQNAALGPSLTPIVPPPVVKFVADEWAAFRAWREDLGLALDTIEMRAELERWTKRANLVSTALADAGGKPPPRLPVQYEWFTFPSEASRRMDLLTEQMAQLQNAAIGQGMTPLVPAALANKTVAEWKLYQRWRDKIGGDSWLSGLTFTHSYLYELETWTRRSNVLRAELEAAGANVPAPLTEWQSAPAQAVRELTAGAKRGAKRAGKLIEDVADDLGDLGQGLGLGALVLGGAAVWLLTRKKGG